MKKQIALIGVSGFGGVHLNYLLSLAAEGLLEIAAVVIRSRETEAEQLKKLSGHPSRIYLDAAEFFQAEAGRIDLVCLPTGIDSHEKFVLDALAAGMNVLVEKPASGSVASVRRMIAAEVRSGKFVAVGFQHCYAPEISFFKELLLSRRLGGIVRSSTMACWPRPDEYYKRNGWAARRSYNGVTILDSPLNNACAHYLNLLLFLNGGTRFGSARADKVSGKVLRARPDIEMFDTCDVVYRLADGSPLQVMFTHSCGRMLPARIGIVCERGRIAWENNGPWSVYGKDGEVIAGGVAEHPGEAMFRRVIARIDDPRQTVCTLDCALEHTACVEMLDRDCPIENVPAVKNENGVFVVEGLEESFSARQC